ncbi:MAG: peptidase M23 [Flavobacteriales bacterium]|nr:MAG: peptidase M23 [Flavobacteriales bacterium]PIE49230.1 MAG: peptidase M23 [Flavobacteriales bacterium]
MERPRCLILLLFLSTVLSISAQSKKELEAKREKLQQEIKETQQLLFKSKKEAETLLSELNDLNKIINVRSNLITTINKEANTLSLEINKNEKQISGLEKELSTLRKQYAEMVVQSYKNKTKQSRLLFLLSSGSFTQAYKRYQYMQQYAEYKKRQGEEIIKTKKLLASLTDSLRAREDEKRLLLALYERQKDSVSREKNTQLGLVKKVRIKEKKYIAEINAKQKEERKLDREIERLIKAAIAKSNKAANVKRKSSFSLTPEAKVLESNFIANKGKLPWPTKRGVVIRKFGKQKHPTLPNITIQSSGIQVATEKGAKARAVFKGKVLSIQLLTGRKKMVLIQHGNYISTYQNLDNVTVKVGSHVNTKQEIGTIHTDAVTGKTVLVFSLYKETQFQNPEPWIAKR